MNAQTLASLFYTAENGNVCVRDDDPNSEAVREMVRKADMEYGLGWDFAYQAVRDALQYLADTDEDPTDPDTADQFADGATDVYTDDLVRWLASAPLKHLPLCDEAAEEAGGFSNDEGLEHRIRSGQYLAYRYAMQAVADNWEEEATDDEEDDTDA